MKFMKSKCQACTWDEQHYAAVPLERKEKDREVVDELTMNQQCALTAKVDRCVLSCISKSVASRSKKVILGPLFSTFGNLSGLLSLFWASQFKK